MTNIKNQLDSSILIKGRTVKNRVLLAPMAGLGHVAFRELVEKFNGFGLLFTGMCSAKAIPHENPDVSPVFKWRRQELPSLVCQIFGSDAVSMAKAAERIEKEGFFGVDLNFGCSVAAICRRGCGAELLKTPSLASKIVEQVRKAVSIPVFVKFRTGWQDNRDFAVDMAKRFEDAGADALVFHPRVAPDRRSRPPRWSHIAHVKKAVSIPVFGNGNIFDINDCTKIIEQTGCDGVSLGRIAVAKPWIAASFTREFTPGKHIYAYSAMEMTRLLLKYHDEHFAIKLFKKFVPYFSANFKFGHSICRKLIRGNSIHEIQKNIATIFKDTPETLERPNLNMFM